MEVWGYPKKGTAIHFWTGSITAGAIVDDNSTYHTDTAVTTTDNSPGGVNIKDGGGNDGVTTIRFDAREVERVLVLFPTVSGGGTWNCDIIGE